MRIYGAASLFFQYGECCLPPARLADQLPASAIMNGYNALSGLMGAEPDLAIFRRFLALNARNVLCLEAEVSHLEDKLRGIIIADTRSQEGGKNRLAYDVYAMKKALEQGTAEGIQWKCTLEVRQLLKEYNMALFNFHKLANLPPADKSGYQALRSCLGHCKGAEAFPYGLEADTWSEENFSDLTSVQDHHKEKDLLSNCIERYVVPWYHDKVTLKKAPTVTVHEPWVGDAFVPSQVHQYSESVVSTTVNAIGTVLSSLLPAISMLALDWIEAPVSRMCTIVVLTFIFSIVFMAVTKDAGQSVLPQRLRSLRFW